MADLVETRQNELKRKKICRFCLSQDDQELTSIYSRENRMKNAPLPLQVMACVSIEVFSNDNMPSFVCNDCRMVFDYCYRFKQMCKKADTCLRHYPLTGSWTAAMEKPKLPPELRKPKKVPPTTLNSLQANQIKNVKTVIEKIEIDEESGDTFLAMVTEPQKEDSSPQPEIQAEPQEEEKPKAHAKTAPVVSFTAHQTEKPNQKLLNKSAIRILNKEAQVSHEPRMSKPVLKRDNEGNVALVTQILDPSTGIVPPDPVETAQVIATNVYPCPHCERSFPLRQLLEIHMVNHTRERSFDCPVCFRSFFSKYDLQKHNLVHTGEKPFKCVVCNKGFTRSTLLHRHEKTHTDIPKFICVFCEKAFISQEEMEKHTERHRKNRPFTCKICDKSFAFKQGLERHEVIHCRFQPFQCHYCDQSFSTPSKLSRHLTAHAGMRPYPCKLCPKSYLLSHHLTRHMRSHKFGNGSYKCNNCDKTFSSRDDLVYHSAVHATQTLVCPLCKDVFEDITTVTNHVKQHAEGEAYACEFCDLIFMTSDRLIQHTNEDHVEDMVVYHEDDQANALAEEEIKAQEAKSDMADNKEIDEAIEEFLIEEFSDSGSNVGVDEDPSSIVVKEETDWHIRNETQIMAESSEFVISEESAGNNVVDDTVDYKNIGDMSESADEPPMKLSKTNEKTQQVAKKVTTTAPLRHKAPLKQVQKGTATHSNSPSPNENKKPIQATKLRSKAADIQTQIQPQPKTRQTNIQAALQGLPKSVSIKKVTPSTLPQQNESKTNVPIKKSTASPPKTTKSLTAENTIKNFILKSSELKKSPDMAGRLLRQRSETSPISKSESKPDTATSPGAMKKPLTKKSVANEKKPAAAPKIVTADRQIVEMMIGDKRVKVQKITMSKVQAAAMAREGRIQMKEGTMILKKEPSLSKKLPKK